MKKELTEQKSGHIRNLPHLNLLRSPIFEPNNYTDARKFYMFDPMPNVTNREEKDPPSNLENTEFAWGL